tara:strand:+ start:213 stop:434 length:222 start_codon:yes stop_codon:yes gene_type:complete
VVEISLLLLITKKKSPGVKSAFSNCAPSSIGMSFRPVLEKVAGDATKDWSKDGRPPSGPIFMRKVLILQNIMA